MLTGPGPTRVSLPPWALDPSCCWVSNALPFLGRGGASVMKRVPDLRSVKLGTTYPGVF